VNPDGLQYCENCGVELKKSPVLTPAPAPTAAPVSGVPYASDAPTPTPAESGASSAPATAQVLEAASQTPVESVGGKVAAMVEEPVMAAVPAPTEGTVINAPIDSGEASSSVSATPSEATVSTPLETPPLETPLVEMPPLEEAMSEAAASGTVSSVQSEPVPAENVHPTAMPSSMGGELPDSPVSSATLEGAQPMIPVPADMSAGSAASNSTDSSTSTPAKLGVKKFGALTGDTIPLMGTHLIVGRFDPSTGPVEIDVSSLPGAEHISRRHAEIYFEDGAWKVRDLGSTNGVFVKKSGETAFSPRLQTPMNLGAGDELAFGNMVLVFLVD